LNTEVTDQIASRTIREWITGVRTDYERIFYVAPGANPAALEQVLGQDDAVLLPADSDWSPDHGLVVKYSGEMSEAGDEFFVNDRGIELQDYISAGFIEIVGPTAIRFFDEAGWRAFVADADLARRTGVFPSALIDPRVLLADRAMFVPGGSSSLPHAFRLDADGFIHLGMQGIPLGHMDNWDAALGSAVSTADALGASVPPVVVHADLGAHPWLPRYMNATELIKTLQLDNGTAKIDGFGWSNIDDERADAEPLPTDPFMLDTPSGLILADIATRRRQLLTPLSAEVVSAIQTSSSVELARDRVSTRQNIDQSVAGKLCNDAIELLNVNLGHQKESPLVGSPENAR
jgi:hypothetical protein